MPAKAEKQTGTRRDALTLYLRYNGVAGVWMRAKGMEIMLTCTASYQASTGWTASVTCTHCGDREETAQHMLLPCSKLDVENWRYFSDSTNTADVFQN